MSMTDDARQTVARRSRWNGQHSQELRMARTLPDHDEDDDLDMEDEDDDLDMEDEDDDLDEDENNIADEDEDDLDEEDEEL